MKALKVLGTTYTSKSAFVRALLEDAGDVMSDTDIARMAGVKPQTVYAVKMKMVVGGYQRV